MGFRQLQDSGGRVRDLEKVVTAASGGTGAVTRDAAVQNLGAIPVEMLDAVNGVGQLQQDGRFPFRYFSDLGMEPSVTIVGPKTLVKGTTAEYFISNFDMALENTVQISGAGTSASLVDSTITVTIPNNYAGDTVDLTVNSKVYRISVEAPSINKPVILFPTENERVPATGLQISSSRFATPDELPFSWIPCVSNQRTVITVPSNAVGVVIRGFKPVNGFADAFIGEKQFRLGASRTILRQYFTDEAFFTISLGLNSYAEYAFIYPSISHVGTDWQVSYSADFSSPVINLAYDTVNKRRVSVNIGSGVSTDRELFIRCRYRTPSLTSPWSDTVSVRINAAGTKYSYLADTLRLPFDNTLTQFFQETVGVSISAIKKTFTGDRSDVYDTLVAVGVPAASLKSTQNAGVVLLYGFNDVANKNAIVEEGRSNHINTITAPEGINASGDFGRDVLLFGDNLFVSDPSRQKVFVYTAQTDGDGSYTLTQTITGPAGSVSWGNALAAYDDVLLIGRPTDATSGIVQVYRKEQDQYVFSKNIAAEETSQWFGTAIEVIEGGNLIAISSDAYASNGPREGRVDFYRCDVDGNYHRIYSIKAPAGYGGGVASNMFGYKLAYNKEQDRLYITAPNTIRSAKRSILLAFSRDGSGNFTSATAFDYYDDVHYSAAYDSDYFGFGDIAFSPSDSVMFSGHVWRNNGIGIVNVFERWLNG